MSCSKMVNLIYPENIAYDLWFKEEYILIESKANFCKLMLWLNIDILSQPTLRRDDEGKIDKPKCLSPREKMGGSRHQRLFKGKH